MDFGNHLALNVIIKLRPIKVVKLARLRTRDILSRSLIKLQLPLAKRAHSSVVNVSVATTLYALPRRQARELGAVCVQIILEVIINALLHGRCKAALALGIAVAEIMALAAGDEVVAAGLVGRLGAIV